jgi:5-methylcytosine-specific restriction endonuclease McrA
MATPKLRQYNSGEWTPARFKGFVTSALRTASRRWPPKFEALKKALVGKKVNKKTNKLANHYKCASCRQLFTSTDVQVDHISPVVDPVKGFVSWDVFIDRLFCEEDNYQVLCKPCHAEKTKAEKAQRSKK